MKSRQLTPDEQMIWDRFHPRYGAAKTIQIWWEEYGRERVKVWAIVTAILLTYLIVSITNWDVVWERMFG
jgi:hypothetical protein